MSGIATHEIGIVHYPGVQVAYILGLTDLFRASKLGIRATSVSSQLAYSGKVVKDSGITIQQ